MAARWARQRRTDKTTPRQVGDAASARERSAASPYVRSRTISAYMPAAADLSRLSTHELKRHRRKLIRILVACLLIAGVLGILASQLTARTATISYYPATVATPDAEAIRTAVDGYYASRPLERLRFLLNEGTLGQYLADKVPEVTGVQSAGADGIGGSRLALAMRIPVASWRVGGQTLFVDKDGVSFTHNYYALPPVEVDDQSGAAVSGSSAVASSSMIRYIGQLIAALGANGTGSVNRVVLPAGMIRELDVYLEGRAYRVKVQLDRDVASQAQDVKAALAYIDAHGGAGEYVDVRVEGKAFYR